MIKCGWSSLATGLMDQSPASWIFQAALFLCLSNFGYRLSCVRCSCCVLHEDTQGRGRKAFTSWTHFNSCENGGRAPQSSRGEALVKPPRTSIQGHTAPARPPTDARTGTSWSRRMQLRVFSEVASLPLPLLSDALTAGEQRYPDAVPRRGQGWERAVCLPQGGGRGCMLHITAGLRGDAGASVHLLAVLTSFRTAGKPRVPVGISLCELL